MKYLSILFIMALSLTVNAQTIVGQWETFDDKTKEKKAVIEVYKTNDRYFAKIVKSYTSEESAVCDICKGSKKGQPILGLVIIENIKKMEMNLMAERLWIQKMEKRKSVI